MAVTGNDQENSSRQLLDLERKSRTLIEHISKVHQDETRASTGTTLLIVHASTALVMKYSLTRSDEYARVYLDYCIAAGTVYASANPYTQFPTPPLFELVRGANCPFAFQIGPLACSYPEQMAHPNLLEIIMKTVLQILEKAKRSEVFYDIYAGISAPRMGPGFVSLFFWIPNLLIAPIEITTLRKSVAQKLSELSIPEMPISAETGMPFTMIDFTHSLVRNSKVAGSGGIVPMMWCADPAQAYKTSGDFWPIVPVAMHGTLTITNVQTARAGETKPVASIEIFNSLDGCLSIEASYMVGKIFTGAVFTPLSSTDASIDSSNHPSPIVRYTGSRPVHMLDWTTYDYLSFIVSSGFNDLGGIRSTHTVVPDNIFIACGPETVDRYNVPELLKLISPKRFDTSKIENLMVLAEILHGLICFYGSSDIQDPSELAIMTMTNLAREAGVSSFDPQTLAVLHSANYGKRPRRSARIIAHYAQQDNPVSYYSLLASRIWSKLTGITDTQETVLLAEAFAAYMHLGHYLIPHQNKDKQIIYVFHSPIFVKENDPKGYISTLLSPDQQCGKLFQLLLKYQMHLNSIHLKLGHAEENASSISINVIKGHIELVDTILKKLKVAAYKNTLTSEIILKLDQEQNTMRVFDRSLGDDPCLMCVKNGTLEIVKIGSDRRIFWRPATPEDMNASALRASYRTDVRGTHQWTIVERYFSRLFANERLRKWYTCQLAEAFYKENNKIATFIVGASDSGKSVHLSHLKEFFGKGKCESLQSNAFSDPKIGLEGTNPALFRAADANIITMEETSAIIYNTPFKFIIGGTAEAPLRTLFQEGYSMSIKGEPIIGTNRLPRFQYYEDAIFTRLAVLAISAIYLNPGDPQIPPTQSERDRLRIYPKDPTQANKIMEAFDALLLYLIDHFDKWCDETGKKTSLSNFPKEMDEMRNRVRDQCPYAQFVHTYMQKTGSESYVTIERALTMFKTFAKDHGIVAITRDNFASSMDSTLGTVSTNNRWYGWVLLTQPRLRNPEPPTGGVSFQVETQDNQTSVTYENWSYSQSDWHNTHNRFEYGIFAGPDESSEVESCQSSESSEDEADEDDGGDVQMQGPSPAEVWEKLRVGSMSGLDTAVHSN